MIKRVIFDVVLILSAFILPWWVSGLLALIGIFIFDDFYEFVITGVIYYSLYANINNCLISFPIFFGTIIIVTYLIIQLIKNNLFLYKK